MTEPIIIAAIIVGGIVALAFIALHFGYKAWSAERADARAAAENAEFDAFLDSITPKPVTTEQVIRSLGYNGN